MASQLEIHKSPMKESDADVTDEYDRETLSSLKDRNVGNGLDLTHLDLEYDSFDEGDDDRPTERWAPLGAAVSPSPSPFEQRR